MNIEEAVKTLKLLYADVSPEWLTQHYRNSIINKSDASRETEAYCVICQHINMPVTAHDWVFF